MPRKINKNKLLSYMSKADDVLYKSSINNSELYNTSGHVNNIKGNKV